MSKKQWGHGFKKGSKEGFSNGYCKGVADGIDYQQSKNEWVIPPELEFDGFLFALSVTDEAQRVFSEPYPDAFPNNETRVLARRIRSDLVELRSKMIECIRMESLDEMLSKISKIDLSKETK